ncbi:ATP-binding cassette, sub-C (CFTR MRP), member 9 [Mortierella sp. AD011]|nr:ATP-binding cassette, sub-C (CFTR MRP), member 9 [Mortierella sp. AD011]
MTEDVRLNPNLLVIVQGLGEVPPGQWARKLFTNGKRGQWGMATQFPFIERARHLGWAVVLCDPNHDENKPRNQKTRAHHVWRVWEDVVRRSDARCVMYVCFSAGTTAVLDLYRTSKREFMKKVKGVAFLDGEDGRSMGRWMQNHSWSFCQDKPKWKSARNETFIPRLDLVIKDTSFTVKPKESVGTVGRTGTENSSLSPALFRIIEAADSYWARASDPTYVYDRPLNDLVALRSNTHDNGGSIKIGGVDTSTLGLKDLPQHFVIIPQDPVVFAGTVCDSLDPFEEHSDKDLWEAP